MSTERYQALAKRNLQKLAKNSYPGRGIVVGTSADGHHLVQIYWIMGRSENSRNRIFKSDGGRLYTEAADPSKMKDPRLIIYNAMAEDRGSFVVSNGDQTDTVIKSFKRTEGSILSWALFTRQYEPDSPNFTPRITALCTAVSPGNCFTQLSILRKSELSQGFSNDHCERFYYEYGNITPGFGYCITTYLGDGNPLPAFVGEPYLMPVGNDMAEVAKQYWSTLNWENRVSLAVKFIDLKTFTSKIEIINQYSLMDEKTCK